MKRVIYTRFLVVFIIFLSCAKEETLQEYLTGSWQTTYLKIAMPSYEKSDSLYVFEDQFLNEPALIAQSKYNADGTFSAWFINNAGERISESEGKWQVINDSLKVTFFYDDRLMNVRYMITKTTTGFTAKSTYDWDNDGEFDDFLIQKTKRIKTD